MVEGELIYLACPYSEGDASEKLREEREGYATYVAGCLIKMGYVVFSPLTHNAPLEKLFDLPNSWDFWCRFDSTFLLKCTRLMVVTLDGWDRSIGVQDEIRLAKVHNIPVEYVNIDDYKYVYLVNKRVEGCHI